MKTSNTTINSYNRYAKKWAEVTANKNFEHRYIEKPAMRLLLPGLKDKAILCIGCGTGEECSLLKFSGVKSIIGIDISKEMIKKAKKKYPDIKFQVMDMGNLSFKNSTFDFIYSSLALHYVDNFRDVLEGISKILKKEGTFLFSMPHPVNWGSQKKIRNNTKTLLMGYIAYGGLKYSRPKKCKIFGSYLKPSKVKDKLFNEVKVDYYLRPISYYINNIIDSGFEITDFIEPVISDGAKKENMALWKIYHKIPIFMIFKLRKK